MATYTSAATGLWSAGATWVGGVKPPSGAGHKPVVAAGHTVTYDEAAGTYGDDTSSTTAANNGIVVNGTLKFSRSVSTQLTCRGTLFVATGGTLDAGSTADPIPSGVTCTIVLNDSSAMAVGKHVMTSQGQTGVTWRINGKPRTRNTALTSAISAGATSITVDASVGWEVGDQIVIASEDANPSNSQVVTISGGSSPTWTVPAITIARSAGCKVGNLSSNVTVKPSSTTYPTGINFGCSATGTLTIDVHDVRFESIGSSGGWVTSGQPSYYGVGITAGASPAGAVSMSSCALYHGVAVSINAQFATDSLSANLHEVSDFATWNNGNYVAVYAAQNSRIKASDLCIYRSSSALVSSFGAGGIGWVLNNPSAWSSGSMVSLTGGALTINGGILRSPSQMCNGLTGTLDVYDANINASSVALAAGASAIAKVGLYGCTFGGSTLTGNMTTSNVPSQIQRSSLVRVDGIESDNRDYSYWRLCSTDTSTRKRSTYAVKIQPKVANTAIVYTFTLPAVSGVAQVIKGSLRFDATYGTATSPSIALSGQGVSASFTAPATADAWHDFTLSFTPTSTGDITATVTVQSASTSGFAWLDGIYHYPMTQSVRHYGYQWLPQAAQIVDTRLTLSEAAALALPIVVDHGAQTITITGSATAREVFEHCIADLCQVLNQGQSVHITSATGETFATTYTVVGAVVGPYTDSAGLHVTITAASLIAGSRVQLYNVTDATELLNTTLGSTGLTYATTWTSDKAIRLRADHPDYLPLEATGILTSSGLIFLAAQAEDTVYVGNGIDGSTVTEFTADGLAIHVDVSDPDGYTLVQRLYAWMQHYQTTSAGIASAFFGAMSASDSANYVIDQDKADIHIDNVTASPLMIVGGYLTRKDGSTVIAPTSGSIQMDPGRAYVAPGGAAITVPQGERVILLQASGAHIARG